MNGTGSPRPSVSLTPFDHEENYDDYETYNTPHTRESRDESNTSRRQDNNNNSDDDQLPFPPQANGHLQSQSVEMETPRARTRGATIRLSASLRTLSRSAVIEIVKRTTINTILKLTITSGPLWNEVEKMGTVIACASTSRLVQLGSEVVQIPFTDDNTLLTKIEVVRTSVLDVPIAQSNSTYDPMDSTIFYDGGARPNPGAAAAAIHVRARSGSFTEHARYYPLATNNITECIALVAALRCAGRLLEDGATRINIVGDSEFTYRGVLGLNRVNDPKLKPIIETAIPLFAQIAGRVCLHVMDRNFGNPADKTCTASINTARGKGDESLFIDPPLLPPIPRITQPRPAQVDNITLTKFAVPDTAEQFYDLRRFPTRSRVPPTMVNLWASILKHYLQQLLTTPDGIEKDRAVMRILTLPHAFLPSRVSTKRILNHLSNHTPFNMNVAPQQRQERTHAPDTHRLTEAVTRLMYDNKMRSANKLVQAASEANELPFADKVQAMSNKIIGTASNSVMFPRSIVPFISAAEFNNALKKLNRQSASAIDGLTKDLLEQAIEFDPDIAALLAQLLYWILTAQLSPLISTVLNASRGVAIPKPDGSIRPICVSNVLLKILGNICIARDSKLPSHWQYAIGTANGHERIIHKTRHFMQTHEDHAVIKIDISNAFGSLPRNIILNQLKNADPSLQQYYRLTYGTTSDVVLYGAASDNASGVNRAILKLGTGVKQGDSTSSYFFALGLDAALHIFSRTMQEAGINMEMYAYMDDVTVCTSHTNAERTAAGLIMALTRIGLKCNENKSRVLANTSSTISYSVPQSSHARLFTLLGANVAMSENAATEFEEELILKQERYFEKLRNTPLHPQIQYTLLRSCGAPRLQYYCNVTPPNDLDRATTHFEQKVTQQVEWIIDPTGHTKIPFEQLHSQQGLGFPAYKHFRHQLYQSSKTMSLTNDPAVPHVLTTFNTPLTSTIEAQLDASYLFYTRPFQLTPAQFTTALAQRVNLLAPHLSVVGTKCNCGHIYSEHDEATIQHILKCDMATRVTHTTRHNMVRDTIARVARDYGITVTKEPTCFKYDDGRNHRPDILFHTLPFGLCTDVTLIDQDRSMQDAEKIKKDTHTRPCANANCTFMPFAMFTKGTLGPAAMEFIRTLSKAVEPALVNSFRKELAHNVSIAAARGRADALTSAAMNRRFQ